MTVGLASGIANSMLNALCRNTAWTQPTAVWIKLHVGDPGASATANAAANTTRQQATFGSTAAGGTLSNTAAITWTAVSTTENYTHYSAWDASTAGTFLFSGTMSGGSVTAGNNFTIAIGALSPTLNVAA